MRLKSKKIVKIRFLGQDLSSVEINDEKEAQFISHQILASVSRRSFCSETLKCVSVSVSRGLNLTVSTMGFLSESSKRRRQFLEISLKQIKQRSYGDLNTLYGDLTSSMSPNSELTTSIVSSYGDLTSSTGGPNVDLSFSSVSTTGDLTTSTKNDRDDLARSSVSPNGDFTISSVSPNGDLTSSMGVSSDDLFNDIDDFIEKNGDNISSILTASNSFSFSSKHNNENNGISFLSSPIYNLQLDKQNVTDEISDPNLKVESLYGLKQNVDEKGDCHKEIYVVGKVDNIVSSGTTIENFVADDAYSFLLDELLLSVSPDDRTEKVSIMNEIPDNFLPISHPSNTLESHGKEEHSLIEGENDNQSRGLSASAPTRRDSSTESLLDCLNNSRYATLNVLDEALASAEVSKQIKTAQIYYTERSKKELALTEVKHLLQPSGLSSCARIEGSDESLPGPLIYSRYVTSDVLDVNTPEVTETENKFRIPPIELNREEYSLKERDHETQRGGLSSFLRIDSFSESLPDLGNNSPNLTSEEASAEVSALGHAVRIHHIEQSKEEHLLIEGEHVIRPSGLSSYAMIDSFSESLPDPDNISHIITSDVIDVAAADRRQTDHTLHIPQIELKLSEDELGESFDHMTNRKIFKLLTKRKAVDIHQFETHDVSYSLKFPRQQKAVEMSSDGEGLLDNDVSEQNNTDDFETDIPEKINLEVLTRSRSDTKAQFLRAKREESEMLRLYGRPAPWRFRRGSKMTAYNQDITDVEFSDEDMEKLSQLPENHKPYADYKRFIMVHRVSKVYEQSILNKLMSRKWTDSCDNPGSSMIRSLGDISNDDTSDFENLDSDKQDFPSTEPIDMPVFDL